MIFLRTNFRFSHKTYFSYTLCLADLHIVTKIYGLPVILLVQVYIH